LSSPREHIELVNPEALYVAIHENVGGRQKIIPPTANRQLHAWHSHLVKNLAEPGHNLAGSTNTRNTVGIPKVWVLL
jgi:hypothetical protein